MTLPLWTAAAAACTWSGATAPTLAYLLYAFIICWAPFLKTFPLGTCVIWNDLRLATSAAGAASVRVADAARAADTNA